VANVRGHGNAMPAQPPILCGFGVTKPNSATVYPRTELHPIRNVDRKDSHILLQFPAQDSEKRQFWVIDHGVCFHVAIMWLIDRFARTDASRNDIIHGLQFRNQLLPRTIHRL